MAESEIAFSGGSEDKPDECAVPLATLEVPLRETDVEVSGEVPREVSVVPVDIPEVLEEPFSNVEDCSAE